MLRKMNISRVLTAQRTLRWLMEAPQDHEAPLRWVDACAGSGLLAAGVQELQLAVTATWGIDFILTHYAAIEIHAQKQRFITSLWPVLHLFSDVREMTQEMATCHIHNGPEETPKRFEILTGGFECDNYSSLNVLHAGPGSLGEDRGPSGRSGNGVLDMLLTRRPPMFMLENVKGITNKRKNLHGEQKSDLEHLTQVLNTVGYFVHAEAIDLKDFGIPQSRHRCYIVGIRQKQGPIDQFAEEYEPPAWEHVFEMHLANFKQGDDDPGFSLQRFLLPDDDDDVVAWTSQRASTQEARKDRARKASNPSTSSEHISNWERDHCNLFHQSGLQWPVDLATEPELADALHALPEREMEIAWFLDKMFRETLLHDGKEIVADLNLNLVWTVDSLRHDVCHCLVGTSKPWLVARRRMMCPGECFLLQGLPLAQCRVAARSFPGSLLYDLAGNAFCGFCAIAVLFALLLSAGDHYSRSPGLWRERQSGLQVATDPEPTQDAEVSVDSSSSLSSSDAEEGHRL